MGKGSVEGIKSGPARIVVTASRPVLFGLRKVAPRRPTTCRSGSSDRASPWCPPTITSTRAAPSWSSIASRPTTWSGVVVGDVEYPGFPGTGATADGVRSPIRRVRLAFFALRYDQPLDTPMRLFARDEAGNAARAEFDHRTFPKPTRQSRIDLDDAFLERVVPAILEGTTEVKPEGTTLDQFLVINGELRRKNNATIASLAAKTAPELLFRGIVFHPFTNTAVESAFADHRTYIYQGKRSISRCTSASTWRPTPARRSSSAARGTVLFADELGIYGNCVIVDHGMGVQSLYAHLSSIGVTPGATVEKDQELGKSGMTGLAGGDHLHFTMLVNGQMVNPVEWWDRTGSRTGSCASSAPPAHPLLRPGETAEPAAQPPPGAAPASPFSAARAAGRGSPSCRTCRRWSWGWCR